MALSSSHSCLPKPVGFYPPIPNTCPCLSIPIPTPFFPRLISKPFSVPTGLALSKTLVPVKASSFAASETTDFGASIDDIGGGEEDEDLVGSPWEGAVVYRRDPSVSHVEYCTTLERLGLGKLSGGVSRSRAAAMGIRLPVRRAKDSAFGDDETPVLVSLDVTRRKRRLKLDGILRTVITLRCNRCKYHNIHFNCFPRCAEPAAECVFSNFGLLLTEEPIEEPDEINMGTIFGQDRHSSSSGIDNEVDDDDAIDLDDRLYFPAEEKEIDISKHIRDIIHVEVTINAVCEVSCKGLCLRCGTNLNKSSCKCSKDAAEDKLNEHGPLKSLRKQMQKT
ncbi:hypothetical protein BHM03_00037479 [Ensete ventricosum]|nr:hypothetical protein BHM03_00037479 [Ensete ventricosum]